MGLDRHHRRSIRLQGYDYATPGAYFVTICVEGRECLFGDIDDGALRENDAGVMVATWWSDVSKRFPSATCDAFVVMPNHVHGIIMLSEAEGVHPGGGHSGGGHVGPPLHRIIQWFKTMTTNDYLRRIRSDGWAALEKRLWQRNYYEHVIRDDEELARIREYINANPASWDDDDENPIRERRVTT